MKQWVQKLIDQLDYDWSGSNEKSKSDGKAAGGAKSKHKITDEAATLLYLIDVYNKNLIDIDAHPVRKTREVLDGFAKELVNGKAEAEETLFRFRQFFSSYRVAEYTYIRKSFEDFKTIIWNFVEQLSDDFRHEQNEDKEINLNLQQLKEAVESDSIDVLRMKSREFIDFYVEKQAKRDARRSKRMKSVKKNLDIVKKQLVEADRSSKLDHLTEAYNRRSFDERIKQQAQEFQISGVPVSLLMMDIDFFKKINDTYGHDIGDFVLKECVRILHETFKHEGDFVARIGGEEFAVILPNHAVEHAVKRAEALMNRIRKEVFITGNQELRFTLSMGIAQLLQDESVDHWIKRGDTALYDSKNNGRNRFTLAPPGALSQVA